MVSTLRFNTVNRCQMTEDGAPERTARKVLARTPALARDEQENESIERSSR
jgi:hypothetical protein